MLKDIFFVQRGVPGLDPEIIMTVFGYPIANSTLMGALIALGILVVGMFTYRSYKLLPSLGQLSFEMVYEGIIGLVQQITGGSEKHASRIGLLIFALMVYLLITNVIGFIPGLNQITVGGMNLFKAPSADFNTTFALAVGSVIFIQVAAIYEKGFFRHIHSYFPVGNVVKGFKKGIGEGFISMIDLFVGILDIVGEFAKIISLSLRLFGNMFAGNVLAIIIMSAFSFVVPAVWGAMNLFTSLLQAFVFAALVAAYYMLAMPDEEVAEEEAENLIPATA